MLSSGCPTGASRGDRVRSGDERGPPEHCCAASGRQSQTRGELACRQTSLSFLKQTMPQGVAHRAVGRLCRAQFGASQKCAQIRILYVCMSYIHLTFEGGCLYYIPYIVDTTTMVTTSVRHVCRFWRSVSSSSSIYNSVVRFLEETCHVYVKTIPPRVNPKHAGSLLPLKKHVGTRHPPHVLNAMIVILLYV